MQIASMLYDVGHAVSVLYIVLAPTASQYGTYPLLQQPLSMV